MQEGWQLAIREAVLPKNVEVHPHHALEVGDRWRPVLRQGKQAGVRLEESLEKRADDLFFVLEVVVEVAWTDRCRCRDVVGGDWRSPALVEETQCHVQDAFTVRHRRGQRPFTVESGCSRWEHPRAITL